MKIKILPSLLAADFGILRDECRAAESAGADGLHLDIMDGHFVPNLSIGPDVVAMATAAVKIPRNVHLMLDNADLFIERFAEAGASTILVHVEPEFDTVAALKLIRKLGLRAGVTLNPATPADAAYALLELTDEVLCMTVEPGYGGQSMMPGVLDKVRDIRREAMRLGFNDLDLMVDGGVNAETVGRCAAAGANVFVAGSFVFDADDFSAAVRQLREKAEEAFSIS